MANLTVEVTRHIDFFTMQDKFGNNYTQANILAVVDSNGILTDTIAKAENFTDAQKSTMATFGIQFDNYGNAYYETVNFSRFIKYGVDSNGTLYAYKYTGEKVKVATNGSLLDPTTNTELTSEEASEFLSGIKASYDLNWSGVSMSGLSLARVIMLITLIRAELVEEQLVNQMDELAKRTALLNGSADAESYILSHKNSAITNNDSFSYTDATGTHTSTLYNYLTNNNLLHLDSTLFPSGGTTQWSEDQKNSIISAIQKKQDELNTIAQETSINIQSLINKRDQSYLLGTNAISLLYSADINVARNV